MHRISWKLYCNGNRKLRLHNPSCNGNDQHTKHSTRQSGTSNNPGPSTDPRWLRWNSSCRNHNRITRPLIHKKETSTTTNTRTIKHARPTTNNRTSGYALIHNPTLNRAKELVPTVKLDVLT